MGYLRFGGTYAFCEIITSASAFIYAVKENEEGVYENGVRLRIAKEVAKSLMEWEHINERIIRACFASKGRKYNYHHTVLGLDKFSGGRVSQSVEERKRFYEQLQGATEKAPRGDMLIVMGDMNAKVYVRTTPLKKNAWEAKNEHGAAAGIGRMQYVVTDPQ